MDLRRLLVTLITAAGLVCAADSVTAALNRAYDALRVRDYDAAIREFEAALAVKPDNAAAHKDLAYTYLKTGESELARDHFAEAARLAPEDDHAALEYAFLCFETKQQTTARRVFDRVRRKGNATASQAFENIDRALVEAMARWSRAVELAPDSFSAHQELARLAEQRDELALAAEHYTRAWQLRPDLRAFLLDLGRVWQLQGDQARANAALLAASRGAEPRVAESARELLPARYPYVYEFRAALDLDPGNLALRRELAYLHLEMGQKAEAEREFRNLVTSDPSDALSTAQLGFLLLARDQQEQAAPLLETALAGADDELADRIRPALGLPKALRKRPEVPRLQTSNEARDLAARSLEAGYLKDALKYLRIAHENDPVDFDTMLRLGWTYNILQDDRQAVEWFRLARKSPDKAVAAEARRAYGNLEPVFARVRTTTWLHPIYSTRWKDLFAYGQLKTEFRPSGLIQPYISLRFSGDIRKTLTPETPLTGYLSESAGILGIGVSTRTWKGTRGWFESGVAASYLKQPEGWSRHDVRGGVSLVRSLGQNLGGSPGVFAESLADAVFVSRFDNDGIAYLRTRAGYTFGAWGPVQAQFGWAVNGTTDARRFQWANSVETGPAVRMHIRTVLQPVVLSVEALQGRYTVLDGTRPPRYSDIRIGIWYAFTR